MRKLGLGRWFTRYDDPGAHGQRHFLREFMVASQQVLTVHVLSLT